jgi:DNA adenine methylase
MDRLRAPIQYYGGKGMLLKWLLPLIPEGGRPYVEPYFGAGSVFFARDPAPVEVLNDLDGDVVTLMRAFQDREQFEELRHRLMWTPYARAEFQRALEMRGDPSVSGVDRAWAVFVTQNMGTSGKGRTAGNWGRVLATASRGMAETTNKWLMRLTMLDAWRWRLMMAQIDNRDALEVIRYWDSDETVFYLDPPYLADTRKSSDDYRFETTDKHHSELVKTILNCEGTVILSCYDHEIYEPLRGAGWHKEQIITSAHSACRFRGSGLRGVGNAKARVKRTETVWLNPKAVKNDR